MMPVTVCGCHGVPAQRLREPSDSDCEAFNHCRLRGQAGLNRREAGCRLRCVPRNRRRHSGGGGLNRRRLQCRQQQNARKHKAHAKHYVAAHSPQE